ncbi:MAG: hypothetical protein IJW12_08075 [Opitutales bacterium]|nr:hypothetical protein [Opitutales bacterium]
MFKDIECLGFDSKAISPLREQKQKAIDDVSSQINGLFDALAGLFQNFKERADVVYDESAELLTQMKYNHSELLPPKEEFIRQARKIEFGIQQFSDSTLLYIPIDEGLENIVDEVVASWMGELSRWILVGMSRGFMFRGAIAMGWGWEIRKNCLTGPVVHDAYKLESEIAKYPRVVFSQTVVDRFNYRRAYAESLGIDMSKIPTFLRLLHCDVDGVYMLDYLSELARELGTLNGKAATLIYDVVFVKVGEKYLEFKERGDSKLAERYWRLICYIREKKQAWAENPKTNK